VDVTKHYHRVPGKVEFHEDLCSENNMHVSSGKEGYFLSGDGYLMPTKKGQAAARPALFQADAKVTVMPALVAASHAFLAASQLRGVALRHRRGRACPGPSTPAY